MERPLAADYHLDMERNSRFRRPSERQLAAFLRSGRATINFSVARRLTTFLPDIDISYLYEFRVKPPQYAWVETDHRNFIRVVVSSGQNQLPSRKISNESSDQAPAVQILELEGAWQLRTEKFDDQHGENNFNIELLVFDPNTGDVRSRGIYRQI